MIIAGSFAIFVKDGIFFTWHSDVTTVQYVTSRECIVLALLRHIRRFFLHAQIDANAIFASE